MRLLLHDRVNVSSRIEGEEYGSVPCGVRQPAACRVLPQASLPRWNQRQDSQSFLDHKCGGQDKHSKKRLTWTTSEGDSIDVHSTYTSILQCPLDGNWLSYKF